MQDSVDYIRNEKHTKKNLYVALSRDLKVMTTKKIIIK